MTAIFSNFENSNENSVNYLLVILSVYMFTEKAAPVPIDLWWKDVSYKSQDPC